MRGEGNHKIPGSFAPENMEKTGAERVKYSLACQHEDAISIKFVSYAQKCPTVLCTFAVALRKESVDRNAVTVSVLLANGGSLSARRAWIEMTLTVFWCFAALVALRKESVDRNFYCSRYFRFSRLSLSARRAWIEMPLTRTGYVRRMVALRKESVDRNDIETSRVCTDVDVALRKESVDRNIVEIHPDGRVTWSLSARRAWIEMVLV